MKKRKGERRAKETKPRRSAGEPLIRQGVPVADGVASGRAHLVLPHDVVFTDERPLRPGQEAEEVKRFRLAVRRARDEIQAYREVLVGDTDETGLRVLDAHLLLLEDPELLRAVTQEIKTGRFPATRALRHVFQRMITALEAAGTEYFRARSDDIRDVKRRILRHLTGAEAERASIPEGAVVVAPELAPSESTLLDPSRVAALITDHGGSTSHAAILARSRGIPAVAGLVDLSHHVSDGDWILVDGHTGQVIVRPGRAELKAFETRQRRWAKHSEELRRREKEPCVTRDGHPIRLLANIESAQDVEIVLGFGAEGIGLYRTEYFFMGSAHLPDEEGQYRAYRTVLKRLRPHPVTIRTLDVGGDKFASYLGTSRADNPFLGLRGIRFLLLHRDVMKAQIRAILRASVHGQARMLFPMISSLEELRELNRVVDEAEAELRADGYAFAERVPRGIMIEVPAAVAMADLLARECDFFSIGSNDLIQYTLAVDRGDERVAHLYDGFHPAVLRALAATLDAGKRLGILVTSCGEISGDLHGAALLVGLGCTSLSMGGPRIPEVKNLLQRVALPDLRALAEEALRQSTGNAVRSVVHERLSFLIDEDLAPPIPPPPPRAGILEAIDPPTRTAASASTRGSAGRDGRD